MNKTMSLKNLAHELDHTAGGINLAEETLDDISSSFLQVIDEMDNAPEGKDLRIHFLQWRRELRILAKLMYHTTEDLTKKNKELGGLSEKIFDEVVRNEK